MPGLKYNATATATATAKKDPRTLLYTWASNLVGGDVVSAQHSGDDGGGGDSRCFNLQAFTAPDEPYTEVVRRCGPSEGVNASEGVAVTAGVGNSRVYDGRQDSLAEDFGRRAFQWHRFRLYFGRSAAWAFGGFGFRCFGHLDARCARFTCLFYFFTHVASFVVCQHLTVTSLYMSDMGATAKNSSSFSSGTTRCTVTAFLWSLRSSCTDFCFLSNSSSSACIRIVGI